MATIVDIVERRRISRMRFTRQLTLVKKLLQEIGTGTEKKTRTSTVKALEQLTPLQAKLEELQAELEFHKGYDEWVKDKKTEEGDYMKYNEEYLDLQCQVEILSSEPEDQDDKSESDAHSINSFLAGLTEVFKKSNFGITPEQLQQILQSTNTKRKQINIPKFSGDEDFFELWAGMVKKELVKPGWSGDEEKAFFVFSCLDGKPRNKCLALKNPTPEEILSFLEALYGNIELKIQSAISDISSVQRIDYNFEEIDELYSTLLAKWNYLLQKHEDRESLIKESWILTALVMPKIPEPILLEWEQNRKRWDSSVLSSTTLHQKPSSFPKTFDVFLADLYTAYEIAVKTLKTTKLLSKNEKFQEDISRKYQNQRQWKSTAHALFSKFHTGQENCIFCDKDNHKSENCRTALQLSHDQKYACVMNHEACLNCLEQSSHYASACPKKGQCEKCPRKHHTHLHADRAIRQIGQTGAAKQTKVKIPTFASEVEVTEMLQPDNIEESEEEEFKDVSEDFKSTAQEEKVGFHLVKCSSTTNSVLQSAIVHVESQNAKMKARVLFDQGSGASLISRRLAKSLGLSGKKTSCTFTLVGQKTISQMCMKVKFVISSAIPAWVGEDFEIVAYVIDSPCADLHPVDIDVSEFSHLRGLPLTERFPHGPLVVDIILGIEDTLKIFKQPKIDGLDGTPCAQMSHLGWIVCGSIPGRTVEKVHQLFVNVREEDPIEKLWELDLLGITAKESKRKSLTTLEEDATSQHRTSTKKIDHANRYETCLITHPEYKDRIIPNNKLQAQRRYFNLEKRMKNDPQFATVISNQMQDLLDKGRAELVTENSEPMDRQVWYLPMSVVKRDESTTTRHRVVFDGSVKNSRGISINDTLLPGPARQPNVLAIWLRFRKHPIILIADIEKMFLQIKVQDKDRDRQRFFFRFNDTENVQIYRLTGITFGLTSSPFSSIQTVLDHVESEEGNFPEAAREISQNIFVDDILTGGVSADVVASLAKDMKSLMEAGGFPLRKFLSNDQRALALLEQEDLAVHHLKTFNSETFTTKSLGVRFHPAKDKLLFSFSDKLDLHQFETRRTLLSQLQKIYDIIGLLSPFLIRGKQILQKSWADGSGWDDRLSLDTETLWLKWKSEVELLDSIEVDRCVIPAEFTDPIISLHGFCDACEMSYGCVIYIVAQDRESHRIKVSNLTAKARVSPLKNSRSLPELELMGALILARLMDFVQEEIDLPIESIMCWTDSQIVLHWIHQPAYVWVTFTSNRVSEIQQLIPARYWRFVPGKLNPSDICSRGCSAKSLIEDSNWWNGPAFLMSPNSEWPVQPTIPDKSLRTAEAKKRKIALPVLTNKAVTNDKDMECNLPDRFEKYYRFVSVMSLCRRLFRKRTDGDESLVGVQQFKEEEKFWIKWAQSKHYHDEIDILKHKGSQSLPDSSKIKNLDPFLDTNQILRVGGRTNLSAMPDQCQHPIILPPHNSFVEKLIMFYHEVHSHTGTAQTWANLQHKFWIARGRREVRRVIKVCAKCRARTLMTQKMAQLPAERITPSDCFSKIGVDFAGPLFILSGEQQVKIWICLFVDMVARGVHLELCLDPSAKCFLEALERMMNRRGRPSLIISDNAKAFKKANTFLVALLGDNTGNRKRLMDGLRFRGIEWRFITDRAPWHGGFYERFVQSVKVPLRKVLGNARLTYSELETILTDIEAQINSRPLTEISSDKEDPLPITPAHLMVGRNLLLLPDISEGVGDRSELTKRWIFRQQLAKMWWNRWVKEYLPRLRVFPKWINSGNNPEVGQLVHVKDEKSFKTSWSLGRIVDLHKGRGDNLIRSVTVLVNGKKMRRPIQKLALLEFD